MKPKASIAIATLLVCLTLMACGSSGSSPSPTLVPSVPPSPQPTATSPSADDVIVVGISADSPPFVDTDGQGNFYGFDIDLIELIAANAGLQIEYKETFDWASVFVKLADGQFDLVISAATITAERQEIVNFSRPYFNAGLAIAVQAGGQVQSPADLTERQVGVQQGTTGEIWLQNNTDAVPVPFPAVEEALQALAQGQVQAVVHDKLICVSLINENPDWNLTLLDEMLTNELYGIAVRPDRPDLLQIVDEQLEAVVASGQYGQLCQQWFGTPAACSLIDDSVIDSSPPTAPPSPAATSAASPTQPSAPVTVRILYGSEKRDWLEPLVETYNAAQRRTPAGALIQVEVTPIGSIEAADAIISGTVEATVWSPASSLYLPLAEADWRQRHQGNLVAFEPQSLVRSPVVIAMWEPMAQALGWPDQPLGWNTVREMSGQNWESLGHSEWGAFKFGHTHPDYSNSGLVSVLAEVYAGVGKQSGLTPIDSNDPDVRAFVAQIESSIIDYGDSTGFFAKRMFDCEVGGPVYLSAAVLYENLVATQPRHCPSHPPVVAIYPQEGTFWTDHPYVVLDAPWVSPQQQEAALDFQAFLLDEPQQQRAIELGFRPADPNRPLTSPLDAQHGVDPQQPQTVLQVPQAEIIRGAQQLWSQVKKAADVVVVMDVSGSMWAEDAPGKGAKIEAARAGLNQFVDMLGDLDRLQIITFNDQLSTLTPLSPVGEKRAEVKEQVSAIQPDGPTRLYDAILQAHQELTDNGDPSRIRAIVVLTDGRDEQLVADGSIVQASTNDLEDVLAAIQVGEEGGNAIKLFTIAYGEDADGGTLQRVAEITGGKPFEASTQTIRQVYVQIAIFF